MASRTHQARVPAPVRPAAGQRVALLLVAALELERPDGAAEAVRGVRPALRPGERGARCSCVLRHAYL